MFKLGQKAKDKVTGLEGIIVAKVEEFAFYAFS